MEIGGKSLLQHVWERARRAGLDDDPIVATDSRRVAEAAAGFGARVEMTASGHRCGSERVAEVARSLTAETVINLQADEVLIDPELLAALPEAFTDPSVRVVTPLARLGQGRDVANPALVKAVIDCKQNVLYFSRQPLPHAAGPDLPMYYGHVGVYAFQRDFLIDIYGRPQSALEKAEKLEQLRILEAGYPIRALIWPAEHFGVNTTEDLDRVRAYLESPQSQEVLRT